MDDFEAWRFAQAEAMQRIAPVFDQLEQAINMSGPVDMVEAYVLSLRALKTLDMPKETLEQFVAVLMADRTHHAPTVSP